MSKICPPYLNKEIKAREVELKKAHRETEKAKKKYELAVEYEEFCKIMLKEAKASEEV